MLLEKCICFMSDLTIYKIFADNSFNLDWQLFNIPLMLSIFACVALCVFRARPSWGSLAHTTLPRYERRPSSRSRYRSTNTLTSSRSSLPATNGSVNNTRNNSNRWGPICVLMPYLITLMLRDKLYVACYHFTPCIKLYTYPASLWCLCLCLYSGRSR